MSALSLRETRKRMGIFQREAAHIAGVSLATWVRWEATNDPRAWQALGLEPQGKPCLSRSMPVQVKLSVTAQERLELIRPGLRSAFVSQLIESATIPDGIKETR